MLDETITTQPQSLLIPHDERERQQNICNNKKPRLLRIGAWTGSSTLRNPERDAKFASSLELDELHLMVADHSVWRSNHGFEDIPQRGRRAATLDKLLAVGHACARHGIALSLTSWIMPHDRYVETFLSYIDDALHALKPVCPVGSLILDAEEPWTRATGHGGRQKAATRLARGLEQYQTAGVKLGLTGIGYASLPAKEPGQSGLCRQRRRAVMG